MSQQVPPQTISIKRKRDDAPIEALMIESSKSQRLATERKHKYIFRRLAKPNDAPQQPLPSPNPTGDRRFRLDARTGAKRHFIEERQGSESQDVAMGGQAEASAPAEPTPDATSRPRKRPGAASALQHSAKPAAQRTVPVVAPSDNHVRELEAFSREVERVDNLEIPLPSPSKHKPKAPARRFADRHPDKAAALASEDEVSNDADAMDVDSEYVIDHYVREPLLPDAPVPTGDVGLLVISEDDEDWWDNEDASDREFDTDDEDSNAEEYYANDYPEDEMSDDDEFDRNLYKKKYRHGSDDEEFNLGDDDDDAVGSGEDEDDLHFKMTVPKTQKVGGYWGMHGE
jgi:hypothetical protein